MITACGAPIRVRLETVISCVEGLSDATMPLTPRRRHWARSCSCFFARSALLITTSCRAGTDFWSAATRPRAHTRQGNVRCIGQRLLSGRQAFVLGLVAEVHREEHAAVSPDNHLIGRR